MLYAVPLAVLGSLLLSTVDAHAHHDRRHHHSHSSKRSLPQLAKRSPEKEAELHRMFKRQSPGQYPAQDVSGPDPLRPWTRTYQQAVSAGLIPTFSPANSRGGMPVYPSGTNGNDQSTVCSWTLTNCVATTDIINAPDGMIGLSWDDGPQPASADLYRFLTENNVPSTHFMIGSRIVDNPELFEEAVQMGGNIAVHTWSHPLMTTMTDSEVLGEIGWTMQIIYDHSDGLIPMFWRPPYGDVDNRVRAIAECTGGVWPDDGDMEPVRTFPSLLTRLLAADDVYIDTDDWCLPDGPDNTRTDCPNDPTAPANNADLARSLTGWLSGPQSPGLIILEHEHKERAVSAFINTAWPLIQSRNWDYRDIPGILGLSGYQNAASNNGTILPMSIGGPAPSSSLVPTSSAVVAGAIMPAGSGSARVSSSIRADVSGSAAQAGATAVEVQSAEAGGLSSMAKIGIIAGSAGAAALLLLIGLVVCIRRRRSSDPRSRVAGQPRHPYRDLKDRGSDISFESKDAASALQASPNMSQTTPQRSPTYLQPYVNHIAARQSTTSVYSQGGDESPLTDYYDSPLASPDPAYNGAGVAATTNHFGTLPPSPPREAVKDARQTKRFHLPTRALGDESTMAQSDGRDKTTWL